MFGCSVGPSAADPGSPPAAGEVDQVVPAPPPAADRGEQRAPEAPVLPPDPTDPSTAIEQIIDLSHRAEQANQAVLAGQQKVDDARTAQHGAEVRRDQAQAAVEDAESRIEKYRATADRVAVANYQGVEVNKLYALMLSKSPQQLLDQMSVLDQVTYETQMQLASFRSAMADAKSARTDASKAVDEAAGAAQQAQDAQDQLVDQQKTLTERIDQVRGLYAQMTGAAREQLVGPLIPDGFDPTALAGGAGPGYAALQVALTRIGDPYVWGATGPDEFDCSGLIQWSYKQVGMNLPRTSQAQAQGGTPVAQSDLRPGDVITFYDDVSHVGIYAGNGMMVHASTFGVPVKVESIDSFPIHNIRRY